MHKKNDPLDSEKKKNIFRSVFCHQLKKIYEMVQSDKLVEFFNNMRQAHPV